MYRVLVGKPEGKRPQEKPRRRWEDNIKADHKEVGCGGMDWIELVRDRDRWLALVKAVMNLSVTKMWGISGLVSSKLASQEGLLHGVSK
jgi:hypothetical protein